MEKQLLNATNLQQGSNTFSQVHAIILYVLLGLFTLFVLFSFLATPFIRKKQYQKSMLERKKLYEKVRVGHKVLLASGILGKIVKIKDVIYFVEIANDVVVKVNKNYILGIYDQKIAQQKNQNKSKASNNISKPKNSAKSQ